MIVNKTREPITIEQICTVALCLLDEHGLEGLSMRTLAARLGVTAMAIYRHVPNKAALLDRILDEVLREIEVLSPGEASWEERAITMARSFRKMLLAHPNVAALFWSRPPMSPKALLLFEHCLTSLHQPELDNAAVVRAYYTLFTYTLGFTGTAIARLREVGTGDYTGAGTFYAGVSSEEHPMTVMMTQQVGMLDEAQFEFGLQMIITGLRMHLFR